MEVVAFFFLRFLVATEPAVSPYVHWAVSNQFSTELQQKSNGFLGADSETLSANTL
jgi:hypothetical protein